MAEVVVPVGNEVPRRQREGFGGGGRDDVGRRGLVGGVGVRPSPPGAGQWHPGDVGAPAAGVGAAGGARGKGHHSAGVAAGPEQDRLVVGREPAGDGGNGGGSRRPGPPPEIPPGPSKKNPREGGHGGE